MKHLDNLTGSDKTDKPDWKQWIPIYGIYKAVYDNEHNKPTIFGGSSLKYFVSMIYHAAAVDAIILNLLKLSE